MITAEAGPVARPAGSGRTPSLRREAERKLIHLATVGAPVLVWVLPRDQAVGVLGAAVLVAVAVEIARARSRRVRYLFLRGTRRMLRPHERRGPAGATHLAISYFVAAILFPKPLAVVAMLYSGLGDAAAALVGKRWGRHRVRWGKSWEGAAAGALVNVGAGLAVPGIPLAVAVAGGVAAAALEFLPIPIDDNLRVTLGGGAVGAATWLLVGPFGAA